MTEQIQKFIEALKNNPQVSNYGENETKQGMILPVLQLLGWNVWDTDEVKQEYPVEGKKSAEGGKIDYCLRIKGKSEVFLEAKRASEDLEKHQEQLLDYSFREGVDLAILSNGILWWFYLPRTRGHWKERKFYAIDIKQQDTGEIIEKFVQIISRNLVQSGEALQNAKFIYEQLDRQKKINETLPKAWNKIIAIADPRLIDLLADTTESICGFRPEIEDVKKLILNFQKVLIRPESAIIERKPPKPSNGKLTKTQQLRINFFEGLLQKSNSKTDLFVKVSYSTGTGGWLGAGIGIYGTQLVYAVSMNKSKAELYIGIPGKQDLNKSLFDNLYSQKNDIENEFGSPLDWNRNNDKVSSNIRKWFDTGLDNPDAWSQLQEDMADAMVKFEKAFRPRLKSIV